MGEKNPDCLFCKIAAKELPANLQYEDDQVVAFDDIHPKAKIHILLVPRKHIPSVDALEIDDRDIVSRLIYAAQALARQKGIARNGYRLVFNVHDHGGQVVDHLHLHLIGGERLGSMA